MSLVPCPECRRHVRRNEEMCPFCAAAIAERLAAIPERRWSTARLGRAALISLAAAGVGTIDACSMETAYGTAILAPREPSTGETGGFASTGGRPPIDAGPRDAEADGDDATGGGGTSGASPDSGPPRRP